MFPTNAIGLKGLLAVAQHDIRIELSTHEVLLALCVSITYKNRSKTSSIKLITTKSMSELIIVYFCCLDVKFLRNNTFHIFRGLKNTQTLLDILLAQSTPSP